MHLQVDRVLLASTAAALGALTLLAQPAPVLAVPQTSACATESCDGFDYSNRQANLSTLRVWFHRLAPTLVTQPSPLPHLATVACADTCGMSSYLLLLATSPPSLLSRCPCLVLLFAGTCAGSSTPRAALRAPTSAAPT